MKSTDLYLLLGTNLGERELNLQMARTKIQEGIGLIASLSSIYETLAWGKTDQPNFLNQVIVVKTSLQPSEVLSKTQTIEIELGRIKNEHWGERIIDIDILYYSKKIVNHKNLKIPHPHIQDRRFTLEPLVEISPDFLHPILKKTNIELLRNCTDKLSVSKLSEK
jgi:2-amino-4-hydroxy-6-hydroxymethyldihydropteridine diphosphokinase